MTEVDLDVAFVWNCPNCNEENFERGVPAELSDGEKNQIREMINNQEHALSPNDVLYSPEEVICKSCGEICIPKKGGIDSFF